MSVVFHKEADGKLLHVTLSGKLTEEDYKQFTPEFEQQIQHHGKLRVLVEMKDFHGWEAGALWDDIVLDMKHFNDIERLALVGDKKWEKGMAVFCKPFTSAEVRFFEPHQLNEARQWVTLGMLSSQE
jgi:hypothetical protein